MDYELNIQNNHYLAVINGRNFIIDTGSALSFVFDKSLTEIEIDGRPFPMSVNPLRLNQKKLEELIGVQIAGLLGLDLFGESGFLCLDKERMTVSFKTTALSPDAKSLPFTNMLALMASATLNGQERSVILDTGAQIGYLSRDAAEGLEPKGKITDYAPSFGGEIKTESYAVPVEICGEESVSTMGEMKGLLKMTLGMLGVDGIIGLNDFRWTKLVFDFYLNEMVFE